MTIVDPFRTEGTCRSNPDGTDYGRSEVFVVGCQSILLCTFRIVYFRQSHIDLGFIPSTVEPRWPHERGVTRDECINLFIV